MIGPAGLYFTAIACASFVVPKVVAQALSGVSAFALAGPIVVGLIISTFLELAGEAST